MLDHNYRRAELNLSGLTDTDKARVDVLRAAVAGLPNGIKTTIKKEGDRGEDKEDSQREEWKD